MDESVKGHYARLLGLGADWRVVDVDLALGEKRVTIRLEHSGGKLSCPECGAECFRHDHAGERTWRHLDTMQFETLLVARVPRCQCAVCGVKTITPSWTDKHSRFTLLFEAFAIDVLRATSGVSRAAALLGLSWDETHGGLAWKHGPGCSTTCGPVAKPTLNKRSPLMSSARGWGTANRSPRPTTFRSCPNTSRRPRKATQIPTQIALECVGMGKNGTSKNTKKTVFLRVSRSPRWAMRDSNNLRFLPKNRGSRTRALQSALQTLLNPV